MLGEFGFVNGTDEDEPTAGLDEPAAELDEPTAGLDEPTAGLDEPAAELDEPDEPGGDPLEPVSLKKKYHIPKQIIANTINTSKMISGFIYFISIY